MSKKPKRTISKKNHAKWEPYLFLAPVCILLLLMFGMPLINSIVLSFQRYKLTNPGKIGFCGFENYAKVFNKDLLRIVGNTLEYVIISVLGQFLLGLTLALALKKNFRGRGIYQSIVFLPWAFSAFVVGIIYRWAFNGEYGVINDLLVNKLGILSEKIAWLGTPGVSLLVVILAMIWTGIPFFAMMILAALQSIPGDVYEAASIDGCGGIKKFFCITMPYIKPTVIMTVLLRSIWILNAFDLIVVITDGGPGGSSQTLPSYMYNRAFSAYDLGLAAAIGNILMLIMLIYVAIFLKTTNYSKAGDM